MTAQAGFAPHVTRLGSGPRKVLALHCTLAFGGAWGGVAHALAPDVTLIAPDMPSHGQSPDWDGVSDFGDTVFDAAAALLRDQGPMDVIGHSFGAAIALRLAVAMPEHINRLVLFEPVFFAVAHADAPDTMTDHESRATGFYEAMGSGDMETAARTFNRMWSAGPRWDQLPERTRQAMTRAIHVVPDTAGFLFDDACGLLAGGVLGQVHVPTLLMRGEDALAAVVATNDGLARRLGTAHQEVIEGAGHMAPITHPTEVAEAIAAHLGAAG